MGITSTHVENTASFAQSRKWLEDHLHTRGEYGSHASLLELLKGSPPHTWRILEIQIENTGSLGITSTHVENTFYSSAKR